MNRDRKKEDLSRYRVIVIYIVLFIPDYSNEDGADRQKEALTPLPPLSKSERGGKNKNDSRRFHTYLRESRLEITEFNC